VDKCRPAVIENIIRKLNAKLGGVNHLVKLSHVDIFEAPVLLIGAVVTHPLVGSKVRLTHINTFCRFSQILIKFCMAIL